jgi:hypothetical protein
MLRLAATGRAAYDVVLTTQGDTMNRALQLLPLLLAFLLAAPEAWAQTMFKCTGADGRVAFQQTPCDTGRGGKAEQLQVPQTNVVEGNPAGDASLRAEASRSAAVRLAIARGQLVTGMTEAELQQAMGQPTVVNTNNVDGRISRQFVYRLPDGSTRYVYTRDGLTYASQERPSTGRAPASRRTCFNDEQIQGADANAGSLMHSPAERERRRAEVQRMKLNRC